MCGIKFILEDGMFTFLRCIYCPASFPWHILHVFLSRSLGKKDMHVNKLKINSVKLKAVLKAFNFRYKRLARK